MRSRIARLRAWGAELRRIVANHSREVQALRGRMDGLERIVRERTEISADVGFDHRAGNTVIICGRYQNRDYVNVFTVRTDDLAEFINHLKNLQRYGAVRRLDAPIGFRAAIEREL